MAYTVDFKDSTKTAITVNDGTVNTTDTSLALVGKNFYNYGEYIAEDLLHLLENFANGTAPANGVEGQMWYDSTNEVFKYYDGTNWVGLTSGGMQATTITDDTDTVHSALVMKVGSTIMAVISADGPYNVHTTSTAGSTADVAAVWNSTTPVTQIQKGFNMNPTTGPYKFVGTATAAEYADLAEMYTSDADYAPGTVVKIGGEAEVTQTTEAFCPDVFGIVSTEPAYLMNSMTEGVAVALEGRVPCKVIGQVRKGQRLVTSEEPGIARAVSDYERQEALDWYRIVGRALEDKTTEGEGLVEVVVGRK